MSKPCLCCGSKSHSLVTELERRKNGLGIVSATCPFIRSLKFREDEPMKEIVYSYRVKPGIIAMACQYNARNVDDMIDKMVRRGIGSCLTKEQKQKLRSRSLDYCAHHDTNHKYNAVLMEHLSPDCICCGSPQHGLLKQRGQGMYEYSCPLRLEDSWGKKNNKNSTSKGYPICPRKLAEYCSNDPTEIWEALEQYRNRGAGKWLKPTQIHQLWEHTFQIAARNRSILAQRKTEIDEPTTPTMENPTSITSTDESSQEETEPDANNIQNYNSIIATAIGIMCIILIQFTVGDATKQL